MVPAALSFKNKEAWSLEGWDIFLKSIEGS